MIKGKYGDQLQMLMRPHQLQSLPSIDRRGGEDESAVWDEKRSENANDLGYSSTARSVEELGVRQPVIAYHGRADKGMMMGNGHHRVAAADTAEKKTGNQSWVPVVHDKDWMGTDDTMETFNIPRT